MTNVKPAAIPVTDISRALGFYQGILGMSATFTNGDPVGFVILKRDAAELHLTLVKGHKSVSHNAAHLMVTDAASLHDHLASNGVRIIKGLRDATTGCAASSSRPPTATASTSARSWPSGSHDRVPLGRRFSTGGVTVFRYGAYTT